MDKDTEVRKYVIGSWRQGSVPSGEGSGMITLTIKDNGGFDWVVTRGGIFSRTMGIMTGMDHIIGTWILEKDTLHLYVKKFSEGLGGLKPHAVLGTVAANLLGTDYGGEISSINDQAMVMEGVTWHKV